MGDLNSLIRAWGIEDGKESLEQRATKTLKLWLA